MNPLERLDLEYNEIMKDFNAFREEFFRDLHCDTLRLFECFFLGTSILGMALFVLAISVILFRNF